jgi:type IV pilus assembly protein PilX
MNLTCLSRRSANARQQGSALVAVLLLLLVTMLMALGSLRISHMQERMAGNTREREVSFQQAEASLRDAEQLIGGDTDGPFSPLRPGQFSALCTSGYCRSTAANPLWKGFSDSDWTSTKTWAYGAATGAPALNGTARAARVLIEYQGTLQPIEPGKPCVALYLLTARSSGVNLTTDTVVQSVFRHRVGECYEAI